MAEFCLVLFVSVCRVSVWSSMAGVAWLLHLCVCSLSINFLLSS